MSSGRKLALCASASLAVLVAAAFLIGGGGTGARRGPYLVQLSETDGRIVAAPTVRTAAPPPSPPAAAPPAGALPSDPGVWSTPAEFAPPE